MPSMTQAIEKLQKRLDKDPNSLVFVQLAEEHRKEGNLEEAIRILKGGLSRHPNYTSARVTLGRIHHQMGNSGGAREELERAVVAVPDHLLANRLLGDIYKDMNLQQEALKRYKIVQMITPSDQALNDQIEALQIQLQPDPVIDQQPNPVLLPELQVESEPIEQSVPTTGATPAVEEEGEPENEVYAPTIQIQIPDFLEKTEVPVEITQNEDLQLHSPEPTMLQPETNQNGTMGSVEPEMSSVPDEQPADSDHKSEHPYLPDTLILDSLPEDLDPDNSDDLHSDHSEELRMENGEDLDDNFESASDSEQLSSLANLLLSTEESMMLDDQRFDELDPEDSTDPNVEALVRSTPVDRTQPIQEQEESLEEADELTTETLAELYLNQGLTDKAMKVYQRLLLHDPDNPQLLKRLQELGGTGLGPEQGAFDTATRPEVELAEGVVLIENHESAMNIQTYHLDSPDRRSEERRRKIHTLENWLTTIRRERE